MSGEMLRIARTRLGSRATLVRGAIEVDAAIKELARLTKPGGRLLLTDVSAEHNYVTTRIPTSDGDVHIKTFKHRASELVASSQELRSWRVERMDETFSCPFSAPRRPGVVYFYYHGALSKLMLLMRLNATDEKNAG